MKVFTLEGGIRVATFAPSPNFNPLTASAAELAANGFAAMPEHPRRRERYVRTWNRIKGKFHYIEPTFRVQRNRSHGLRKPSLVAGPETSNNWSGGVVYAAAGQTFQYVLGEWVVPARFCTGSGPVVRYGKLDRYRRGRRLRRRSPVGGNMQHLPITGGTGLDHDRRCSMVGVVSGVYCRDHKCPDQSGRHDRYGDLRPG